jgi:3-oxoacyl-[acyl-carrier-protein] synthase-3
MNKTTNKRLNYPDVKPLDVRRFGRIISTGKYLPDQIVTNEDVIEKCNIFATARAVEYSTGIKERRWEDQNLITSDFLYRATQECLDRAGISPEQLDRVFYSKLIGDHLVPGTALKVLQKMGVRKGIPACDMTVACSGFAHILDLALRYIDTGDDYILILTGAYNSIKMLEGYHTDTQTSFLMGDGSAAILIGQAERRSFVNSYLYTNSDYFDIAYIPFGTALINGDRNYDDSMLSMKMEGRLVNEAALEAAVVTGEKLLEDAELTIDDIDYLITSDQTPHLWADILKGLNCPPEKSLNLSSIYANTVAAMTPLILDELISSGKLKRGMKVLMMAHGAGSAGGGFIFEY